MYLIVLVVHVVVSLTLIGSILLQHGKGADAGVAFGSAGGSGGHMQNMGMTKFVGLLAVSFFATSLALGFLSSHNHIVGYGEVKPIASTSETVDIDVSPKVDDSSSSS